MNGPYNGSTKKKKSYIGMIVQGVHGLASVLGVIESVLEDDTDNTTCITLMICCKSEEDIVAYK